MAKEKHIVYVRKVGDHVDDNAFGGHYVTKESQARMIQEIKEGWKRAIKCPKQLVSKCVLADDDIPYPHMVYSVEDNPYFGWSEKQLKIVKR